MYVLRTGKLSNGSVHLKKGDDFYFVNDFNIIGDATKVFISGILTIFRLQHHIQKILSKLVTI